MRLGLTRVNGEVVRAPFRITVATSDKALRLAVLVVERDLEPNRLAVRGGPRAPAGGQLLDQVEAAAPLVGGSGRAQPGEPEVRVEDLHPDRLRAAPQPHGELAGPVHRGVVRAE